MCEIQMNDVIWPRPIMMLDDDDDTSFAHAVLKH